MSIYSFFFPDVKLHHTKPDYEILFGWCPRRKLHMQHASAKQLLETELISEEDWKEYFKFSFVRNPWDRAYSDYLWIQNFSGIKDSFKNYIHKKGKFNKILRDNSSWNYLGDHLYLQNQFFEKKGLLELNYIGRFENISEDMQFILNSLNINDNFNVQKNKSTNRYGDYSKFYTNSKKKLVEKKFEADIKEFNYSFVDRRNGIYLLKKLF